MEHTDDFGISQPIRRRRLQYVVALVGIEGTELIAEHRLVVGDDGGAADDVVEQIELAAEMRVPVEPRVVAAQPRRGEVKIVAGEELGLSAGWRRLLVLREHRR